MYSTILTAKKAMYRPIQTIPLSSQRRRLCIGLYRRNTRTKKLNTYQQRDDVHRRDPAPIMTSSITVFVSRLPGRLWCRSPIVAAVGAAAKGRRVLAVFRTWRTRRSAAASTSWRQPSRSAASSGCLSGDRAAANHGPGKHRSARRRQNGYPSERHRRVCHSAGSASVPSCADCVGRRSGSRIWAGRKPLQPMTSSDWTTAWSGGSSRRRSLWRALNSCSVFWPQRGATRWLFDIDNDVTIDGRTPGVSIYIYIFIYLFI